MGKAFTEETKSKIIDEQLKIIKNDFPFEFSKDCVIYLNDIDVTRQPGGNKYMLKVIDNNGYKYYSEYRHIRSASAYCKELAKFFKRNPYTYDNINNFCKINNIDLYINGEGRPCSGIARDKLDFIQNNGEILKVSWNEIQREPERYRRNYCDVLFERKKTRAISKEEATEIIYSMQSKLDRPIDSRDFRKKQNDGLGIKIVLKHWKEVRFMQEELGLAITGKYSHVLSDDECLKEIKEICNKVYETENRKTIMYSDIQKHGTYRDARPYSDACKNINTTLSEYIKLLGFGLQNAGNGFNHIFEDNERVVSKNEYDFSMYLRSIRLIYNKDYYRDIKYKTLTSEYDGKMNCDYEIHFNGRIFYVELAGMLNNVGHEKCYRENIPINSKSKEKYRLDLMKKKSIFVKENLEHYILLKSEMNEDTYKHILNVKEVA